MPQSTYYYLLQHIYTKKIHYYGHIFLTDHKNYIFMLFKQNFSKIIMKY